MGVVAGPALLDLGEVHGRSWHSTLLQGSRLQGTARLHHHLIKLQTEKEGLFRVLSLPEILCLILLSQQDYREGQLGLSK